MLNKVNNIFTDKNIEDHGRIEIKMKLGLGNQEKQKPEEMKFIKCIIKGFQLYFSVDGSAAINFRFRKNI